MTSKLKHSQLKNLILRVYDAKLPLFIWGTMGIGKSEIVKDTAKQISQANNLIFLDGDSDGIESFGFIDVRISQLDPSDLRGLPTIEKNVNGEAINTKWITPNWLPKDKDGAGILFLDELNLAMPSIQNACYQLILDRKIGDYSLPDGWIVVSAGNTSDDKAYVFDMSAPLSNRFIHAKLEPPTLQEWTNWAMDKNIKPEIISFLQYKPHYLYKFDSKNKEKSFATPRMWFYVNKLLSTSDEITDEEKEILLASAVGEGIAIEFSAFSRLKDRLDIDRLLLEPTEVKKFQEVDLIYSLLGALTERYKKEDKSLQAILKIANELPSEFSVLLYRFLKTSKPSFSERAIKFPEYQVWASKNGKFITDYLGDGLK